MSSEMEITATPESGTPSPVTPLTAVLEEGERLFARGQSDEARQHLEDARRGYWEGGDASSEGAVLRSLATFEFALGHQQEAERYLELACERYNDAHNVNTAGDLSLSLGDVRTHMGRVTQAREAYLAAAKLFRTLDDPLGQAHAEFKLAQLHAPTNHDMAQRHYHYASTLYDRAHARMPSDDALRLDNPHLPEHFEDCRHIDAWIMARVARREADRLRTELGAAVQEETEEVPQPKVRDVLRGAAVFIIVPAVFIGVVYLFTQLPAFPMTTSQLVLLPLTLLAGAAATILARTVGVESRAVRWVGALIVCATVQIANLALTRNRSVPLPPAASAKEGVRGALAKLAIATDSAAAVASTRAELDRALATVRERGDRHGEAEILNARAGLERRAGQPGQAAAMYGAALEIYRELDDRAKQPDVLIALGETHRSLNHLAQARESFSQAADLYQQRQDAPNQAKMLTRVGDLERSLQRPKQARAAYARAVELSHERDPAGEARTLLRLGKLEMENHATDIARKTYGDALALSEQGGDVLGQAAALLRLGELEVEAGRHDEAARLHTRGLELYRTRTHVKGQIRGLRLLGDLERSRKQLAAARDYYAKALALSEEHGDKVHAGKLLIALADTSAAAGDREQARETYTRALTAYEAMRNVDGQITTLRRLSQLAAKDNLSLAQQYAKRAATLQERGSEEGAAAE